jgi:hypothetical protein
VKKIIMGVAVLNLSFILMLDLAVLDKVEVVQYEITVQRAYTLAYIAVAEQAHQSYCCALLFH